MSNDILDKLDKATKNAESLIETKNKLLGKQETILENLKKDYGVNSLEEAEEKLKSLEKEQESAEKEIEELCTKIDEIFSKVENAKL